MKIIKTMLANLVKRDFSPKQAAPHLNSILWCLGKKQAGSRR